MNDVTRTSKKVVLEIRHNKANPKPWSLSIVRDDGSLFPVLQSDHGFELRPTHEPGLSLEERMHRFPKRGWAIDVGVPFSASDPEAEHPLTFRAKHLGGDWDEFESLDLDGAVTWLEQRLGITKPADCPHVGCGFTGPHEHRSGGPQSASGEGE